MTRPWIWQGSGGFSTCRPFTGKYACVTFESAIYSVPAGGWRGLSTAPHCAALARRRAECFLTLRRDSSHYVSRGGASPASDHHGWHNGYTSLRQTSSARSSQHIQGLYSVSPPSPQSPHFGCSATYSACSSASAQACVLALGRS